MSVPQYDAAMYDVAIVGAGPAGSAAAAALARRGRRVLLVEQDSLPRHKVCGEFLSTEAQGSLQRLGLRDAVHSAGSGGAALRRNHGARRPTRAGGAAGPSAGLEPLCARRGPRVRCPKLRRHALDRHGRTRLRARPRGHARPPSSCKKMQPIRCACTPARRRLRQNLPPPSGRDW